jgi:predicted Zn-dependent peptidase
MLGGSIGAGVTQDYSEASCHGASIYFLPLLRIFAEVLFHPSFKREEVEKEKEALIAAIRSKKESIYSTASEQLNKCLYKNHPYGRPNSGTELTVKEVLKGELDKSTIEIREIGGTIGQATLEVPAAAQFTRGEDIVVLLSNRDEDGAYELDGMGLGKFYVEKNANGEEILASGGIEHEEKVVTLQSVRERFRGQKIQEKARSSGPAQSGQTANVEGKPPQPAEPSLTVSDPPLQSPKGTRAVLFAFLALGIFYFIIRRNRKSRLKS